MTDIQKALADLKARQEAGEHMPCPRCGKDTMKPALYTNALSRVADGIMVCDDCGTQEALLAFMQNPMPVDEWAFLNPDLPSVDFKDLPGKAVWEQIRMDHGPALISIFKRWTQEEPGADFKPYRREAMKRCPGLTQIWEQPFQAMYEVSDGQLILRFRHTTARKISMPRLFSFCSVFCVICRSRSSRKKAAVLPKSSTKTVSCRSRLLHGSYRLFFLRINF